MYLSKKSRIHINKLQNALICIETLDDIFFLGDDQYMDIKEYLQKKKDYKVFINNIQESIAYFENYIETIMSCINCLNDMKMLVSDYGKNRIDGIQYLSNIELKYNTLYRQLLDIQTYSQYNNVRFYIDSDRVVSTIYSGYDRVNYYRVSIDPKNQIANVYTNMTWKNNKLLKNTEIICYIDDGKLYDADNILIEYIGDPIEYIEDRLYLKNIDRLNDNEFNNYINNFYENVFIAANETMATLNTIKHTLLLHHDNSSKIIGELKYDRANTIAHKIDMIAHTNTI